ncbi:MAG: 6-pyruvoyl-tetrahydropterin synthase-related protein [Candidatus Micrarchaeota archaeon]
MRKNASFQFKRHLPYALFILVGAAAVSASLFDSGYPISIDHPARLVISWQFGRYLLSNGEADGFNPFFYGGMPATTFYPPLAFALPSLIKLVSLDSIDWISAYKIAVFLSFFLITLSVYFLAAAFGLGRTAGLFSAFFFSILDFGYKGGSWEANGGFYQVYSWGMWNNALGIAFSVLAIAAFLHYKERKRIVYTGILTAFSLLSNTWPPFWGFLGLAVLVVIESAKKRNLCALRQFAAVGILVFLFCAFWILPFLFNSSYQSLYAGMSDKAGYGGRALSDLIDGLLSGKVIGVTLLWLSACGALISFRKSKPAFTYLAIMAVLTFLWMLDTHFADGIPFLNQVQNFRFLAYLRIILAVFAGVAASEILKLTVKWQNRLVAFAALALIAYLTLTSAPKIELSASCPDISATYYWISSQPGDFRVAYYGSPCSWHGFDAAPLFTGKYSLGVATAFSYCSRPIPRSSQEFDMWNVKYAVTADPDDYSYFLNSPEFSLERSFGVIAIFSKKNPAQSYFESNACKFEGEAGNGFKYSADAICSKDDKIIFKFSYYPYWKASVDGVPVALEKDEASNRIALPVSQGTHALEIHYERGLWEKLLFPICALAVLALFAAAKFNLRFGKLFDLP